MSTPINPTPVLGPPTNSAEKPNETEFIHEADSSDDNLPGFTVEHDDEPLFPARRREPTPLGFPPSTVATETRTLLAVCHRHDRPGSSTEFVLATGPKYSRLQLARTRPDNHPVSLSLRVGEVRELIRVARLFLDLVEHEPPHRTMARPPAPRKIPGVPRGRTRP
jgi:hypothetical protein